MDASYWKALPEKKLSCGLCPHRCVLGEGKRGLCGVRENEGGRMVLPLAGLVSALAIDPMEKKPLFHFLPGTMVFSAGFFGCNMACPFCQNWRISQDYDAALEGRLLSPRALVDAAIASASPSLAFTYSEPSIHIEYLLEAAGLARQAGLATVLVTNGSLLPGPASDLLALMDAVNVDLKAWSDAAYREILRGDRGTVLSFIEAASKTCHLEVTTLVVPGVSDGAEGIQGIAYFLGTLGRGIPLHLSAYHPDWRWDKAGLPQASLAALAALARKSLDFVYLGNTGGIEESRCPSCGGLLASRRGYQTRIDGLEAGLPLPEKAAGSPGMGLCGARCASCGAELPFVLPMPRRI